MVQSNLTAWRMTERWQGPQEAGSEPYPHVASLWHARCDYNSPSCKPFSTLKGTTLTGKVSISGGAPFFFFLKGTTFMRNMACSRNSARNLLLQTISKGRRRVRDDVQGRVKNSVAEHRIPTGVLLIQFFDGELKTFTTMVTDATLSWRRYEIVPAEYFYGVVGS